VYLPPQYFQPRFAHTTFPVLELLHGTPGRPSDWVVHLRIVEVLDRLIARHQIGPMIVVLPTMSSGHPFQECVNGPSGLDDTYVTTDVRTDVLSRFRASPVPAEWGIAGYSSGGYCAANLALRHPAAFGASGIMDGYYRPTDGPAAAALNHDPAAERANDPLLAASRLGTNVRALPSFWVAAGTGNAADLAAARAFTAALHGVEQVTLYRQPGAAHNLYAWSAAAPHLLQWFWAQLAPPALRVQFPITGPVTQGDIATPTFPVHARHGGRM
jgi:enterochelin esterase-like enzyme